MSINSLIHDENGLSWKKKSWKYFYFCFVFVFCFVLFRFVSFRFVLFLPVLDELSDIFKMGIKQQRQNNNNGYKTTTKLALYNNSKSAVMVDGNISEPFKVSTGVLQGDVLAP